jgi:inner membrane protein involved in colicin E2 resistance
MPALRHFSASFIKKVNGPYLTMAYTVEDRRHSIKESDLRKGLGKFAPAMRESIANEERQKDNIELDCEGIYCANLYNL